MNTNLDLDQNQKFLLIDFYLNAQLEAPILWRGECDDSPDPREGGGEMLPPMQWDGE